MSNEPNPTQSLQTDPSFGLICDAVASGRILLFLGAGVHASPEPMLKWKYSQLERPLFASELATKLAAESGWSVRFDPADYPPSLNFSRVALDYELNIENDLAQKNNKRPFQPSYYVSSAAQAKELRANGRTRLGNVIKAAVEVGKQPSAALRALAELDFTIIVTTNYDSLFWDALITVGKSPTAEYYVPGRSGEVANPADDPTPDKPFLFQIHGSASDPSSMVITDEDYIDFVLHMSTTGPSNPVPGTIYYRMRTWPTLFIGYRLQDFDLRLLMKTLRYRKEKFKTCYLVDPCPDSLIKRVWDDELKYISFVVDDLWTFVPALYRKVKGVDMP